MKAQNQITGPEIMARATVLQDKIVAACHPYAIVGMAHQTNAIANGLKVPVDEEYLK